jgi:hypothetical protein
VFFFRDAKAIKQRLSQPSAPPTAKHATIRFVAAASCRNISTPAGAVSKPSVCDYLKRTVNIADL